MDDPERLWWDLDELLLLLLELLLDFLSGWRLLLQVLSITQILSRAFYLGEGPFNIQIVIKYVVQSP